LESSDDNEAEEISILKDKDDELLKELLDDSNYYSAEENEYYFEEGGDTDNDGSGSVFVEANEANTYQYQDTYADDLAVNTHNNIPPSEREVLMGMGTGGRGLDVIFQIAW
jgi:hypothetical protein